MIASMRTNWTILKTSIEERLVYRGDFAFATLVRFLPLVTQIFLWTAIFAGATATTLNSYTANDMIAYYLLVMVARAFSSMPGLANGIAEEVRNGTVKKYLTQPIDMLGYLFWHRVAHKLVYYIIAIGPFALIFFVCRRFFPGWPPPMVTLAFCLSLVMGFLIGFLLEALIGLIAFWFLEVSSLLFIYMMINYFLSGHMIPLEWLSDWVPWITWLPFKYLAWFPPAIMLGKVPPSQLPTELAIEATWIAGLFIANRIAFARGVRRYGAFGG